MIDGDPATPPSTRDSRSSETSTEELGKPLSVWKIGLTGGLVGILCCVGPTMLALLGVVSAGTAFVWATDLYDGYAWWFRLAGLLVLVGLVWVALRRRQSCSVAGLRRVRWRLLAVLGIASFTYVALYGLTTWLGTFA